MKRKRIQRHKLGKEPADLIFNKVWEITRMTWPEPFSEQMDRSRVKLIRLYPEDVEQELP